jgi:hypothetical protein
MCFRQIGPPAESRICALILGLKKRNMQDLQTFEITFYNRYN